ncbi:MAG TPA: hypothetical protein VGG99_11865 [Acetobacteraceae bacterium]
MTKASRAASVAPDASADAIARTIADAALITCDVFDTAIARSLARPEDLHLATGARAGALGLTRCSAEAFRDHRIAAETSTRAALLHGDDDEIPLAAIHRTLQSWNVVTDGAATAALEFLVERSVCRPILPVRDALLRRRPAQRLVFLSDSTLPGDWLATILTDCGYGDRFDVISSADIGRNKAAGGLFRHLLATLECKPQEIVHLGDNPVSDVVRPREFGIRPLHLPAPRIPPEPESVARRPFVMRLAHSHRRSRAVLANAAPAAGTADEAVLHDPRLQRACLFPLIGFSLFLLAEARRRGIRRIYFLARDGHLPLAIVRRLNARRNDPVELTYLHCSRQAIVVPTLQNDLPQLARHIADGLMRRPLRHALACIGLDAATTAAMAHAAGLDPDQRVQGALGRALVARLLDVHARKIEAILREHREAALAYLDQAGFLQPGPRMIVDVGWRGSVQKALTSLSGAPAADIFGCYLGLWAEALSEDLTLDQASGYLFSFGSPKWTADIVRQGYILFELFFSSPDPTISHYARQDGQVTPIHAPEPAAGASVRRQAFAAIERTCLADFDSLDAMLDGAWPDTLDPAAALGDMVPLLTRPSARDVAALNRIPYVHGLDGGKNVPPVNQVPLLAWLKSPSRTIRRIADAPWQAGTLRASLPRFVPDVGFPEFRDRFQRLCRALHLAP